MTLLDLVASQLKSASNIQEFDRIFRYHFKNDGDGKGKREMEARGVDFNRFKKAPEQPKEEPKEEEKVKESKKRDEIDIAAATKMIIDRPLLKKSK